MAKMVFLLYLFSVLISTAKAQESLVFLPLHDPTSALELEAPSLYGHDPSMAVGIHLETENLKNVSRSVLMAETWLRNYVLPFYPSTNITAIVVAHSVFCNRNQQHELGLVLPAIKNIHYSLTRWGLQNDIKATTSLSSDCLNSDHEAYRDDLTENHIRPLLSFLQEIGSPYVVNPPSSPPPYSRPTSSDETLSILKSHRKSLKNLGVNKVNVVVLSPRTEKPTSRKLSFIDISKNIVPFPGPAAESRRPTPPVGTISPNPGSPYPFMPHLAPISNPGASPTFGPHLPPCQPPVGGVGGHPVGAPVGVAHRGLWCVAKPSVPPETLQEALDYACGGEGGADCGAIREDGSCYYPDTIVAHASYAFNSYWQKNKRSGGTCGFGGTAMLINSDPRVIVIADSFLSRGID
ncbi:hypothetical protein OROGR_028588 [Orobanche gracilis]